VSPPEVPEMPADALDAYILACAWRYVAAIPDNAERNFIWRKSDHSVFSLDEDNSFRETGPSAFRLAKVNKEILQARVNKSFEKVLKPALESWLKVFQEEKKAPVDLKPSVERIKKILVKAKLVDIFNYKAKEKKEKSTKKTTQKRKAGEEPVETQPQKKLSKEEVD